MSAILYASGFRGEQLRLQSRDRLFDALNRLADVTVQAVRALIVRLCPGRPVLATEQVCNGHALV
jgi:hypothetical protein